jgi:NDP-sugar pyrophosphorylase family protein
VDAMIFAAGLGTRLADIGQHTPKALIEIAGITMLERASRALIAAGADRIIVNAHHHADRIARYIESTDLGVPLVLSLEPDGPLETGGGLLHAQPLLRLDVPFFLYNVDVITDADLRAMYQAHLRSGVLATLAVNQRETSRRLLFDDNGLFGREDARKNERIESRKPKGRIRSLAFAGIHIVSPELLPLITERGVFSILEPYLRLAGEGHCIESFSIDDALWLEIGNPERLAFARKTLEGAENGFS